MCLITHLMKLCDELFVSISEQERRSNHELNNTYLKLHGYLARKAERYVDDDALHVLRTVSRRLAALELIDEEEENETNRVFQRNLEDLREHLDLLQEEAAVESKALAYLKKLS
jgi:hypothetical protein